jgi:thiamine pyrophosphokinase
MSGTALLQTAATLQPFQDSQCQALLLVCIFSATPAAFLTATTKICADGGANRLYDQISGMLPGMDPAVARISHLPDLIKGDLDSVRLDVQDFYTSRGVPFVDLSSDQETTDLEKCLLFLEGRLRALSDRSGAAQATPAATGSASTAAVKGLACTAKGIHAANAVKAAHLYQGSSSSNGSFCSLAATVPPMQDDCSTTSTSFGPPTPSLSNPACSSINQHQHQHVSHLENVQWSSQQQQQEYSKLVQLQQRQQQLGRQEPAIQREMLLLQQAGPRLQRQLHAGRQQADEPGWHLQQQQQQQQQHEMQASILDSSDGSQDTRAHQHHTILVLGKHWCASAARQR